MEIARDLYGLKVEAEPLDGDQDFNFKLINEEGSFLLKVSRPDFDQAEAEYQQALFEHIFEQDPGIELPRLIPDVQGNVSSHFEDRFQRSRLVRLLTWMPGRVYSSVNPKTDGLLHSIGTQAGLLTKMLQGFNHPYAHRFLNWDLFESGWTKDYLHLFTSQQREVVEKFLVSFNEHNKSYIKLRQSVVHSDVNDNNLIVSDDMIRPRVISIIDFGDTIYTQTINDLAIAVAYGIMDKPDVLSAAMQIVKGYHQSFPLLEKEIDHLHTLVAMRLIISVTMSSISKQNEPENIYRHMSENQAWSALRKWSLVNQNLALISFRKSCDFVPLPTSPRFQSWAEDQSISVLEFFPELKLNATKSIDMSVSSLWLGHVKEYSDMELFSLKLERERRLHPGKLLLGGYLERRPIYSSDNFMEEGNDGPEYRTAHLGVDLWVDAQTAVHSVLAGVVHSLHNNDSYQDYGPTLILKHETRDGLIFYSLYGHLSIKSLTLVKVGQAIHRGDHIAYVGDTYENGTWAPHLHFQLILNLMEYKTDFPGVAVPGNLETWAHLCPDPNLLFKEAELNITEKYGKEVIQDFRKAHLGRSLSLSYEEPLEIVRGVGVYLIDADGQKYLDTVNNVAHVGHEHPAVVEVGRQQIATINTNTRYLHKNIIQFAESLLETLPEELSVVHFVNSGSEANELALRMTKAITGQRDMLAVELGYHGNSNACVDVSSYKFDGKGGKGAPEHTHIVPLPDHFRGIYQGDNTGHLYANHIQEQIGAIISKGRSVGGFICETIISCGGQIELPQGYLDRAYSSVREAGGLCIADEVQVGCGRVGSHFWGFQMHDVIPDIVTIGKPIGNGHPLAAVVCTTAVADAFADGMEYFNTFGGNPVSCVIGSKVLQVIKEEKLQENALAVGGFLKNELLKLQVEFPVIGEVRGQGLFLGFELNKPDKQALPEQANYLVNRMRMKGVLMSTDGMDQNVIKIKPPLVFSRLNAEELVSMLRLVFRDDFMCQF